MVTTIGQSIPNVEDRHRRIRLANLTKLIDVELDLLKDSFEEARRRIDPMISQINQARNKFNQIQQQGEEEMMKMERELRELKQTTSKLKSKIPFALITPPDDDEYQQPFNSLVVDDSLNNTPLLNNHPPLPHDLNFNSYGHHRPSDVEQSILWCFLAFPDGAFIKTSLLCSFVNSTSSASRGRPFTLQNIASAASELVSEGFIKPVYNKKHSSTTAYGFWMDPLVRHTLKDGLSREVDDKEPESLVISSSSNGEDIFCDGPADASTLPSDLDFLHLGKWQRTSTHYNIEMPDPNLYFKYAGHMHRLKYISFRGVSVMKELPSFITTLKELRILDLKACHHLEVIPSDIDNLWCWLTYLDMSECYFLDHMPASLSRLINLRVLKGFFVGETNNEEEECCTLQDLSSLRSLMKLNIYTSLKSFPSEDHLTILQGFGYLRNLTICWGGCSTTNRNCELTPKTPTISLACPPLYFRLEKLDLRGVPETGTHGWLKPSNFKMLEKFYIRGGHLNDLTDQRLGTVKHNGWSVKVLRLRHLSKLQMNWTELQNSFPNLVCVEIIDCPNLTSFPSDDRGLWTKDTRHSHLQPPLATLSLRGDVMKNLCF